MSSRDDVAANRKEQIIDTAAALFAENGYYKTTTAQVANAIGVTQPYVFHFFRSKEELYLAVLRRASERVLHTFSALEAPADKLVEALGDAFSGLLATNRNEILLVMMAYTTPEPAVRELVKDEFDAVFERVKTRFSDAGFLNPGYMAGNFIAIGLLISMSETLNMPKLLPWDSDKDPDHS
ncbi:TetR/AcrR family transcriptional regulator [Gorillibacterium massiliense]|uniref:TetR/AcrR family transcriptional regulator n=1 Tax=Gorillibacterium massiliense TaxID=1280390 RepID=UPI0004AF86E2|nr:TetR/AcrR family transcriptional regulator [Gorillibacterium massiliense]